MASVLKITAEIHW